VDFFLEPTLDPRRGDALEALERLFEPTVGEASALGEVTGPTERYSNNGVEGGVETQDNGIFGFNREDQPIELFPDVEEQQIHIGAPVELEGDLRDPRS